MTVFDSAWWRENLAQYAADFKGGPAYDAQERMVCEVLASLHDVQTTFEVGCGFGRITRYLPGNVIASDVAPMPQVPGVIPFDLDNTLNPPDLYAADLVVAAEVLMHRPPDKIERDARMLASLTRRYILTADWHEDSDRKAEGCWQHDYVALFGRYGKVYEYPVPEALQAVYLVALTQE